jgi:hypothetical protein
MDWRRGIRLAGINLAIGCALIFWSERANWKELNASSRSSDAKYRSIAWQDEGAVTFDPCHGGSVDYYIAPGERIVQAANLPIWILTGWKLPCPAQWTIAGKLHTRTGRQSAQDSAIVACFFCATIPIQWFLAGAFPLIRPRRRWSEPGAFITACAVISLPFLLISTFLRFSHFGILSEVSDIAVELLSSAAILGWLWWVGLLLWKSFRGVWRLISGHSPSAA